MPTTKESDFRRSVQKPQLPSSRLTKKQRNYLYSFSGLFKLCFVPLFLLQLTNISFSHLLEAIPLDSWVYETIEQLHTQKVFPKLHQSIKPYSRGEIAIYLRELETLEHENKLTLTRTQRWLVDKLKDEFKFELLALKESSFESSIKYNLNPVIMYNSRQEQKPVRSRSKLGGSYQYSSQFVIKINGIIDTQGEKDPQFFGTKWKNGLSGYLDQAYVHWDAKVVKILFGRDNQRWGSTVGDGLLFSGNAPPLDQIRLSSEIGYFKFVYFSSVLDQMFDPDSGRFANRYISAHGVSFKHPTGFEIVFSEVVVYGGFSRQLELYYLNPILPYYVEQHNHKGQDDNLLWSLDVNLNLWKDKEVYGQLLIDDFQYDFKTEPHQIGYSAGGRLANLLGLRGSILNLEYSRINFWIYGATLPWNRLSFHEVGLGSSLGPDADRIKGRFLSQLREDISILMQVSYMRKGEGRIAIPYPGPLPTVPKFPSGIVEKTTNIELLGVFQPDTRLKAELGFVLVTRKNIENVANRNENNVFSLRLSFEYNFWREKGI